MNSKNPLVVHKLSLCLFQLQPEKGFLSEIVVNELGISMVEFTKDLLLSNVQQTDQGLYQCIASNAVGERSTFIGLIVEAEIDSTITNLKVTADHKNAQFNLKWYLPHRMDYLDAQSSIFLLNYYLSDGGSANNVPLKNVQCTPDNWCVAKCCSSDYIFFARRNYTFQMSVLKMGSVGKITPLSEHVTALSWDGVSRKALDLTISSLRAETVEISWDHPSADIANGIIQKYIIEYYKDSEPVREVKRGDVSPYATSYLLNGLESGSVYRFRVIPVTRHGPPSNVLLKSNSNYTFIGYLVDYAHQKLHPEIGTLPFDIEQRGSSVTVRWKEMQRPSNYVSADAENQAVLMRYAQSDTSPLKEKAEEGLFISRIMNLSARFDTSLTYQFCSRLYDGLLHGPDFCRIHRLPLTSISDLFTGISVDDELPRPVWCDHSEGKECRCEPSYEFGDAMRVIWDWPADDFSADEFIVHYTLSDSVLREDDRLVITDEAFADLPNLRSNTTYRIMVEARNKLGGVEGSWFNCTTPTLRQIPAPTGVMYEEINASAVRVSWNPIHPNPRWSTPVGYVIQIQSSSSSAASVTDIPVDGMSATSYVVKLQPNMLYTFQVAARTSTGDLGQRSSPYLFAPSNISKLNGAGALSESDQSNVNKKKAFLSRSNREGVLIGIVLVVGLLTLCFGGICAHLRLKRRKLEMGLNAIASGKTANASLNSNYEMEELIARRRNEFVANEVRGKDSGLILHRNGLTNEAEAMCLDTKGGERGAMPSGQDKYLRLLNDKKQLQRFKEALLNVTDTSSAKSHKCCRKKTSGATNQQNEMTVSSTKSNYILLDSKWIRTVCGTSNLWSGGSLPSKKQMSVVDSTITKPLKGRNLNISQTSALSSYENATAMPRFLSKLAALSDISRRSTTSYLEQLNQADSYASIICPRSASVQSDDYQGNNLIVQQDESLKKAPKAFRRKNHCACNSITNQTLDFCDADIGSIENGCYIMHSPRDTTKMYNSNNKGTTCSSMPNLTDSGIVYDEMHPPLIVNHNQLES